MGHRDNVIAAIERRGPDHLPLDLMVLPITIWDQRREVWKEIVTLQNQVRDESFPWLWIGSWAGAGRDPDGVPLVADEWGTAWRIEAVGPNARGYPS